jgi:hypothetical protein
MDSAILPGGLALTAGVLLACGGGEGIPVVQTTAPALIANEIQLAAPFSSEDDELGFALASAVEVRAGRLVVLETGNDRLVVFDDQRHPSRYIGRGGAGPGEIRGAVGMAAWRNEYAVVEVTNARVSVFDTSGGFIRSFGVPNGFSNIAYGPDGTIYVNSYDRENYLLAARREGELRPFGRRPLDRYPADILASPVSRIGGYIQFAVAADGVVHVYDGVLAALVAFDRSGRPIETRRIPPRIAEGLRRRAALVAKDFGGDGVGAPASITDLSLADDGRLLLLFSNLGAIGLLIDPRTYRAQEIRWGPGVDPSLAGYGGVVRGDVFYRLSMDDLRLFRLTPE